MTTATARTEYRALVAAIAAKAKEVLPQETNGRVEKAVALVLAGDVEPQADGSITVGSCIDPLTTHRLIGTSCSCDDFQYHRAPGGWCKHRIAAGLHKRVGQFLAGQGMPTAAPEHIAAPAALPEAPASINLRAMMGGFEVQITLRDHDESALLTRLGALLKRPDIRPVPKPATRTGAWKKGH